MEISVTYDGITYKVNQDGESKLNTADFSDIQISYVNWNNFDIYTITKKVWLARNPIWSTL